MLGRTAECQEVQLAHAARYVARARELCTRFGVGSARALALMFDIMVQHGGINAAVSAQREAAPYGFDQVATADERNAAIAA